MIDSKIKQKIGFIYNIYITDKNIIFIEKGEKRKYNQIKNNIPAPGLEPGPRERQNFKSCMSTNSIIRVHIIYFLLIEEILIFIGNISVKIKKIIIFSV
jgi:hypothetical protein